MRRINYSPLLILFVLFFSIAVSCTQPVQYVYQEQVTDEYLSGYPIGDAGSYLMEMQQSVKRISNTTYYRTHVFDPEDRVRPQDIQEQQQLEQLTREVIEDRTTSSGSAIVIYNRNNRIGLLTTNHTVTTPDTIYEYADETETFLESVTYKTDQLMFVMGMTALGELELLASDPVADLAVLGTRVYPDELDGSVSDHFPLFPYPLGNADELKPGVFLYVLGYPRGYPMVTSGIVGATEYGRRNTFITDALFNPGISGGAIVAIRGGIPSFEWMGMARSSSATGEWLIVPSEDTPVSHHIRWPYDDQLYLERKNRIDYGITHAISAQQIKEFLETQSSRLSERGYRIRF